MELLISVKTAEPELDSPERGKTLHKDRSFLEVGGRHVKRFAHADRLPRRAER